MSNPDTFHAHVVVLGDLTGRPAWRGGVLTVVRKAVGLGGNAIDNARNAVIPNAVARHSREHADRELRAPYADHVQPGGG